MIKTENRPRYPLSWPMFRQRWRILRTKPKIAHYRVRNHFDIAYAYALTRKTIDDNLYARQWKPSQK